MTSLIKALETFYGISPARIIKLDGYANSNFKIETKAGPSYVLKVHSTGPGIVSFFRDEATVLGRLAAKHPGSFPGPVPGINGEFVYESEGPSHTVYRLLKWVDGEFFYSVTHTPHLCYSLGRFLGELDADLQGMRSTAVEARRINWDLQYLTDLSMQLPCITNTVIRKKVRYFLLQYRELVLPRLCNLRKSIIHNDANDWNILVTGDAVSGLIDFGDMVYAPLIQEVAVCLTYALFGKSDPLLWSSYVLKGYHEMLPLEPDELDVLYYLIAGRLCMSLLNSASSRVAEPENEYLGVSELQAAELLDKWLEVNPLKASNAFRMACGFDPEPAEDIEMSLKKRFIHISPIQSVSYRNPVKMEKAAFQYMYDAYGNTFLDAYNNIPHVGHQHPEVVEAGQRQMARLNTNTRYVYDLLADYSEKLLDRFPAPLNKVFFVNSGSAASDLAIRMAQTHTGLRRIMVLDHGYHGNTRLGIDISHYKFGGKGGKGQADYILRAPIPDTYRGAFTQNDGSAGISYAQQAFELLEQSSEPVAAFIAEPIVGCAGQVPLAKEYLKQVYPAIREQGGVCISDEVQTGFGRVGSKFWGFELQEVIPDIVVLGKPMGNGHPLAAVVTTDEIANSFDNGMEFFSSFGGNPVSCAIGKAVLKVIDEEGLQENARVVGSYFSDRLTELMNTFDSIGDVRGHGLFLGVEFVRDRASRLHDPGLAAWVKNRLRDQFILVSTDGPEDNIIKMKPPLCFTRENAEAVVNSMEGILAKGPDAK